MHSRRIRGDAVSHPGALRRVGALILAAVILCAAAGQASFATDRAIRETVEAGEDLMARMESFRRANGRAPSDLSELANDGRDVMPPPAVGGAWRLVPDAERGDAARAIAIDVIAPDVANRPMLPGAGIPGVPSDHMLVRGPDGCWRLPALGYCWRPERAR